MEEVSEVYAAAFRSSSRQDTRRAVYCTKALGVARMPNSFSGARQL